MDFSEVPQRALELYTDTVSGRTLIFNPLTGKGPILLKGNALKIWQEINGHSSIKDLSEISQFPPEEVAKLLRVFQRHGISYTPGIDIDNERIRLPHTLRAWFHLTHTCTLECKYCYIHKSKGTMTTEIMQLSIDALFLTVQRHPEMYNAVMVTLTGGEPLTKFELIKETVAYSEECSKKLGIPVRFALLTNGTLLPEGLFQFLKTHKIGVSISLDGLGRWNSSRVFPNERESVDIVTNTIATLVQEGIYPFIMVTVADTNLHGLPELTEYLMRNNFDFRFSLVRDLRSDTGLHTRPDEVTTILKQCYGIIERLLPEHTRDLGDTMETFGFSGCRTRHCAIGWSSVAIDPKGDVYFCQTEINDKPPIAHVSRGDLLGTLFESHEHMPELVPNLTVDEYEDCDTCFWRYHCGGGCPIFNKALYGDLRKASPYCAVYQVMLPFLLRIEALNLIRKEVQYYGGSA